MIRSSLALTRHTGSSTTRRQRRHVVLVDHHHHEGSSSCCCLGAVMMESSFSSSTKKHPSSVEHYRTPVAQVQTRTLTSLSSSSSSSSSFPTTTTTTTTPFLLSNSHSQHLNPNHHHHHAQPPQIQIRTKTYVSQHNNSLQISPDQIMNTCQHHGIHECKSTSTHVIVKECPFCPKPTHGKASNHFKLYIKIGGGAYFCHRCGANGSWYDFKQQLNSSSTTAAAGTHHRHPNITMEYVGGSNGSPEPTSTSQYTPLSSLSPPRRQPRRQHTPPGNSPQQQQQQQQPYLHPSSPYQSDNVKKPLPLPRKGLQGLYTQQLGIPSLKKQQEELMENSPLLQENPSLEYLVRERGLSLSTLKKYGVGSAKYNFPSDEPDSKGKYVSAECITFPWIMASQHVAEQESLRDAVYEWEHDPEEKDSEDDDGDEPLHPQGPPVVRRIKARAVQNKGWQRLDPPGGGWGLFGYHLIPPDYDDEIIITEGEYDAMAVYQATGRYAVSLPNGCRNLPLEVLPLIEKFQKVYLWMDHDRPGKEGAEKFSNKIGLNRCVIVDPSHLEFPPSDKIPKDANEALLEGYNLNDFLDAAQTMPHDQIAHARDYRLDILEHHLHPEKYAGIPIPSLPSFTKIMKGFRLGEMTVLTGSTGSGKTTFLSQLSLDFAEQGINTLWGSFEVKNTQLLLKMIRQFAREPLPTASDPDARERLMALQEKFEGLPLHFMKFHGSSDIEDVMDAMDYAVYVYDVQHIIIDNMQFMTQDNLKNGKAGSKFENKYDRQDHAISQFRQFATDRKVHVTLVVHPKKVAEGEKLGIDSFYGGGKATQEADNVLVLQKDSKRKYIEVKKNRHDGTLGFAPLHFQQTTGRYAEVPVVGGSGGGGGSGAQLSHPPPPNRPPAAAKKKVTAASGTELENHWSSILSAAPPPPEEK